jgi:flagellar hook-associated protein 2
MASTITAPTYDPTSTASALADKATAAAKATLATQTTAAKATASALASLNSAINAFQAALTSLTGSNKTLLAQSAALSDTSFGSAVASGRAVAGTYDFFVEQLATAGQTRIGKLADSSGNSGTLRVALGSGAGFDVDLAKAAGDGTLSVRELAAAINNAEGNGGTVAASVVTLGTDTQLVLTSTATGAATGVSLDLAKMGAGALKTALSDGANVSASTPQDAVAWIGGKAGTKVTQASNTFSNIDGLSVTFTKAQAGTDPNLTVTVKTDTNATGVNAKAFVDAYNKLKTTIDGLMAPVTTKDKLTAGPLGNDADVKALQARMVSLLRPTSGLTLASFGISAQRDGTLALDSERLNKQLAITPTGLDGLLGSTAPGGAGGLATRKDDYLDKWSGNNGQIKRRQSDNSKLQDKLATRQDDIDRSWNSAYSRYLLQFTNLQALQSQMGSNLSLFDALFGNDKS